MYEIEFKKKLVIFRPTINIINTGNKNIEESVYNETVDFEKLNQQYRNMINIVHIVTPFTILYNLEDYQTFNNIITCNIPNILFIRDSFISTQNGIWLTKMKNKIRYKEKKYIKNLLNKLCVYIYGETKKGFLEGGDVYMCNNIYCFIGMGTRSNYEGIMEFMDNNKYLFDKFIIVYPNEKDDSIYRLHLDSIFGMLDKKTCILWKNTITDVDAPYYRYADEYIIDKDTCNLFKNKIRIPFFDYLIKENINVIPISNESQKNNGCSILNLGNKILVQDRELEKKIKNSIYINLTEINKMYGGIHSIINVLNV